MADSGTEPEGGGNVRQFPSPPTQPRIEQKTRRETAFQAWTHAKEMSVDVPIIIAGLIVCGFTMKVFGFTTGSLMTAVIVLGAPLLWFRERDWSWAWIVAIVIACATGILSDSLWGSYRSGLDIITGMVAGGFIIGFIVPLVRGKRP